MRFSHRPLAASLQAACEQLDREQKQLGWISIEAADLEQVNPREPGHSQALAARTAKNRAEREAVEKTIARLRGEIVSLTLEIKQARERPMTSEEKIAEIEAERAEIETRLSELRAERDRALRAGSDAEVDVAERRFAAAARQRDRLDLRLADLHAQLPRTAKSRAAATA